MSTATANSRWVKKAENLAKGDFEQPKGGSYPAVLVAMIDMGTTDSEYKGKVSKRLKVLLVWELTGEFDSKGNPFVVQRDFTFSLKGANGNLRDFVEAWEGRSIGDQEDYDFAKLLGRECMINLTEGKSAKGNTFIEVASASMVPKGLVVPKPRHDFFMWDIETHSGGKEPEIPDWIPMLYGRKVADDIKKSDEWLALPPF